MGRERVRPAVTPCGNCEERPAAAVRLHDVRNALAALDGHTCHEGHTDADHLRLYRAVVAEIAALVGRDAGGDR